MRVGVEKEGGRRRTEMIKWRKWWWRVSSEARDIPLPFIAQADALSPPTLTRQEPWADRRCGPLPSLWPQWHMGRPTTTVVGHNPDGLGYTVLFHIFLKKSILNLQQLKFYVLEFGPDFKFRILECNIWYCMFVQISDIEI
jgi:hypothetical protein